MYLQFSISGVKHVEKDFFGAKDILHMFEFTRVSLKFYICYINIIFKDIFIFQPKNVINSLIHRDIN